MNNWSDNSGTFGLKKKIFFWCDKKNGHNGIVLKFKRDRHETTTQESTKEIYWINEEVHRKMKACNIAQENSAYTNTVTHNMLSDNDFFVLLQASLDKKNNNVICTSTSKDNNSSTAKAK